MIALVHLFVIVGIAFVAFCLLIPIVGVSAVLILAPFQALRRLLGGASKSDWLLLCGVVILSAGVCLIWNPGWGIVALGAGATLVSRRQRRARTG